MCLLATFRLRDFLRHLHCRVFAFATFSIEYSWLVLSDVGVGVGAGDSVGVENCNGFVDAVDLLILTL